MTDLSWQIFEAKFPGKTQAAFQDLCLYVFCHLCGAKEGVFSYANHAGMETEDVLFQGKHIGFQAKYYRDHLSQREQDIRDSIIKTRAHNTRVQKLLFFLPIDPPGVSSGVDAGQKPKWMSDAEATAEANHLEIEWFGTSRFQVVLAHEDLQFIARHFFDLNLDLWNFIAALDERTHSRLSVIHNSIPLREESIHLEHQDELDQLEKAISPSITIISGIGGVGKTAIVKDWFERYVSKNDCAFILQPNEVIDQFNDVEMSKAWRATPDAFFSMTAKTYGRRILVVDSVEKLEKNNELSELLVILHRFLDAGWKIILTTRTIFESSIVSPIQTLLPEAKLEVIKVRPIGVDALEALSVKHVFPLPSNLQVRDAIRTAFNLSVYLTCKQSNAATSLKMFQEIVWSHFVLNDDPTDTAGQTFCRYVEEKLKNDAHVISILSPSDDTKRLEQRGIIAQIKNAAGYVISHDIYEEWATIRMLDGKLSELGLAEFEKYIASSHGLRRGFQLQVEQRLAGMEDDADPFLSSLLATKSNVLQSDLMLALIRSEHIGKFLKVFSETLLAENSTILESITATTYSFGRGPDTVSLLLPRQRPEGFSWRAIIDFAQAHQEALQKIETPSLLQLMQDWVLSNPKDDGAVICSRFAWNALALGEPKRGYSYQWEERLADLILCTSVCDEKKFEETIRNHLSEAPDERNDILDTVCKRLLTNSVSDSSLVVIQAFPQLVRDIAWVYWRPKRKSHEHYYDYQRIEGDFGLAKSGFNYYPPSACQGPVFLLLRTDPIKTISFIIDFVNECVADAARAEPKRFDSIAFLMPDGKKVEQKISWGLWNCYRDKGYGEPVPDLLKAMHMALEQYLLELAEVQKADKVCETILWSLLRRSKSASLTAVVASIVMAHPMEFVLVGLVLIAERKVFMYDFQRYCAEMAPDVARSIFPFPKGEHDYLRDEADKHSVRGVSLDNVIWQYQVFESTVVPNLKERVQKILDEYETEWDSLSPNDKFWLTRIDIRRQKLQMTVDEKKQTILSSEPILSDDMKELRKKTESSSADLARMMRLSRWGKNRIYDQLPQDGDAYCDIGNVIKDFQWLINKNCSSEDDFDVIRAMASRATAAALTMFYSETLQNTVLHECERVLIASMNLVFSDRYEPTKLDHVGMVVFAMPFLLPHLSWRIRRHVRKQFVMALLNEDENGFFGEERLCDWGMAGVRMYCDRTGDMHFRKWMIKAYRRHFLRYQTFIRNMDKPRPGSVIWNVRVILFKILKRLHVRTPSWLQAYEWMMPTYRLSYRNRLGAYAKSIVARHWGPSRSIEDDLAHLACNAIGFYFSTKLVEEDERVIVSDVKDALEFLFWDERRKRKAEEPFYYFQMRRSYLKQLGYCALNMSRKGCLALLNELAKVPRVFQKPELLDGFLVAQYGQHRPENFWQLWNGLLPIVSVALANDSCNHRDSQQVLDTLALKPLYSDGDEQAWLDSENNLVPYFESLVEQFGKHRYLAVSVMKFACGPGKRFLLHTLKWINRIIALSQDEYDRDGANAVAIKVVFECLVPQIETRIEELKADKDARANLISVLDHLVSLNSPSAFRIRESLFVHANPKCNTSQYSSCGLKGQTPIAL